MHLPNEMNAAFGLEGKVINEKWLVTKRLDKKPNATGGFFSVCYAVENISSKEKAFLKALNFIAFFQLSRDKNIAEVLKEQTSAYEFEKNLLSRCKNNRLSKVATIIDEGQEILAGFMIPQVPYMVFELADGDLRSRLANLSEEIDNAWKIKSLHNIALGIQQLHSVKISHQDLKPSNVLIYEKGKISKIGDLGRSLCQDIVAPHENEAGFTGDFTYAPPEINYGHRESDWIFRTYQTDLYMFASLACFYFTNSTLNSLLYLKLDPAFHYIRWRGRFDDVKDYLTTAFDKAMDSIEPYFESNAASLGVLELIRQCGNPIPGRRGLSTGTKNYKHMPFEPIISRLDLLAKKAEIFAIYQKIQKSSK